MTRLTASETEVGSPVTGLHADFALLTLMNESTGKEVVLETIDGSVFHGIFGGVSGDMKEVGLFCVDERTEKNRNNILPMKDELTHKKLFLYSEIINFSHYITEEKTIKGFATDQAYHSKRNHADMELQEWEGDGEEIELEEDHRQQQQRNSGGRGWNPNEMFAANQHLGVTTSFKDDLTQYTTAEIEGDEEARRRADEIARQIESNQSSKIYAALENDDDERDLDKATNESELLGEENRNRSYGSGNIRAGASPYQPRGALNNSSSYSSNNTYSSANAEAICSVAKQLASVQKQNLQLHSNYSNGRGNDHQHQQYNNNNSTQLQLANNRQQPQQRISQNKTTNNRAEALKDPRRSLNNGPPMQQQQNQQRNQTNNQMGSPQANKQFNPNQQNQNNQYNNRRDYEDNSFNGKGRTFENPKLKEQNKMLLETKQGTGVRTNQQGTVPNQQQSAQRNSQSLHKFAEDMQNTFRERKSPEDNNQTTPSTTPTAVQQQPHNAWIKGPPQSVKDAKSESAATPKTAEKKEEGKPASVPVEKGDTATATTTTTTTVAAGAASSKGFNDEEKTHDETDPDKDDKSSVSSKKFSFNPNAPSFTPKTSSQPTQQMGPPMNMMQMMPSAPMYANNMHPGMMAQGGAVMGGQPMVAQAMGGVPQSITGPPQQMTSQPMNPNQMQSQSMMPMQSMGPGGMMYSNSQYAHNTANPYFIMNGQGIRPGIAALPQSAPVNSSVANAPMTTSGGAVNGQRRSTNMQGGVSTTMYMAPSTTPSMGSYPMTSPMAPNTAFVQQPAFYSTYTPGPNMPQQMMQPSAYSMQMPMPQSIITSRSFVVPAQTMGQQGPPQSYSNQAYGNGGGGGGANQQAPPTPGGSVSGGANTAHSAMATSSVHNTHSNDNAGANTGAESSSGSNAGGPAVPPSQPSTPGTAAQGNQMMSQQQSQSQQHPQQMTHQPTMYYNPNQMVPMYIPHQQMPMSGAMMQQSHSNNGGDESMPPMDPSHMMPQHQTHYYQPGPYYQNHPQMMRIPQQNFIAQQPGGNQMMHSAPQQQQQATASNQQA